MKRIFRRNQIIITTLAIMIAAAGYLNYSAKKEVAGAEVYEAGMMEISDEDILAENQAVNGEDGDGLVDIASLDKEEVSGAEQEAEQTGIENPGEAVLTNGTSVAEYIAGPGEEQGDINGGHRQRQNIRNRKAVGDPQYDPHDRDL